MAKMYFPQYARGRDGVDIRVGESILAHIRKIGGIEIDSECGGRGVCGKDAVRIEQGSEFLSEPTQIEKEFLFEGKLPEGQRLACQTRITQNIEDIKVFIPDFGRYTILTDIVDTHTELDPCVCRKDNRVVYHTGEDQGPYLGRILGLAIDVGTTTLVMQVVDLETGENVGKPMASKNPQIAYGNDVISRIGYARDHDKGLGELQASVIDAANKSLAELEQQYSFEKGHVTGHIYDIVAIGNSTMRSVFFGQNVHDLGVIPFEPISKAALTRSARSLGIKAHSLAMAYGPPLIGGHAGADCVADIIATRLYEGQEITMVIDIGTNGEIAIGNREKILTASCAAGGAYEGYQIGCGAGAIQGAVTEVRIRNGKAELKTLGNKAPLGVCGSGVIDLLAEMLQNGIMNERARIKEDYYLTDTLCISQDDINQLIMAKAGLRTDQDLLIDYYGTELDNVKHIYLAGAFGNFMNIENAMAIGLLPNTDKTKFVRFGNGALAGARDMLVSRRRRQDAESLCGIIRHTKPNEIEGQEFQYMVAQRMYFGSAGLA